MTRTSKSGVDNLTEHEGTLLSLLAREQPATAHQLYRVFESSPVTSINASKGQIYPAIRRLRARGFIHATAISVRGAQAEELRLTQEGMDAVRAWVKAINPSHVVLDDPLRTRMLSFPMLDRGEQLEWIAQAKALVKDRRGELEEYSRTVQMPYQNLADQNIAATLNAKMDWLDELLYFVATPNKTGN